MKNLLCLLAGLCLVTSSSVMAAPTINYNYAYDAINDVLTTPYAGMVVDTFDTARPGWVWSGDQEIVSGSLSGKYAAPYNNSLMTAPDATSYLTVPMSTNVNGSGSASLSFNGQSYTYLGLFWGSIDNYNTIDFMYNGSLVASYAGSDLTNPANGNQMAPSTNLYVNFLDLPEFDEVVFSSTQFAFEIDNVAVGATPVPAPAGILLLGTGLVSFRRFRRKLV